jgi:hypothetical protein
LIDKLIALDDQERREDAEKYPEGISLFDESMIDEILNGEVSPTVAVVGDLSRADIVYLTALAWFGRGDGVAEPGANFQSVLKYSDEMYSEGSVGYLCAMPPSKYLPRGLKRLGLA